MDRQLARKNIRSGLLAGAVVIFMFAISFVAALIYISRAPIPSTTPRRSARSSTSPARR